MGKERVVITGSSGFLGTRLQERLGQYHVETIRHQDLEKRPIASFNPDIIFNLAAYGNCHFHEDVREMYKANVMNLLFLLESSEGVDYRAFINVGTSSEYGETHEPMKDTETYTVGAIQGFMDVIDKNTYGDKQMAFPPWGGFFKKEWINFAPYLAKYPKDKLFYREADRIFSILLGKHHKVIKLDVEELCTHEENQGVALCEESNHLEVSKEATRRALEL